MYRLTSLPTVLIVAALTAPSAGAGSIRTTIAGKITVLQSKSVTVLGRQKLSCRVGVVSPRSLGYVIGSGARISCTNGLLTKIVGTDLPLPPIVVRVASRSNVSTSLLLYFCGSAPSNGEVTFAGTPDGTICATGMITSFGPSSSDDSCRQTSGVGQSARYNSRICASVTVGSNTCGLQAGSYTALSDKYAVGQRATIGCFQGRLEIIRLGA